MAGDWLFVVNDDLGVSACTTVADVGGAYAAALSWGRGLEFLHSGSKCAGPGFHVVLLSSRVMLDDVADKAELSADSWYGEYEHY
jgi:hypothetical protein